jgi:hypothetical protein
MPASKIEYGEYKSLLDIIESENQDNTYEELMKKEKYTLDTVNKVVKYYQDHDIKNKTFANMSFYEIIIRTSEVWTDIFNDIINWKSTKKNALEVVQKEDRLLYIGIFLIFVSLFIFFIVISD